MNPEKEVLNWWLHKRGFFTMNSIRISHNKEIDTFAICLEDGQLKEAIHIESLVSTTPGESVTAADYSAKFDDPTVIAKVKDLIANFVGKHAPYRKMLIIGLPSKAPALEGIEVEFFENVLADVILHLDKQNYRNNVIRTLQLMKYIMLSNPSHLARLLKESGPEKVMTKQSRERFVQDLVSDERVQRTMGKQGYEAQMISLLKESSLQKPERLATALLDEVLTPRTRKRFIRAVLEHKEAKPIAKMMAQPKGTRQLQDFMR